MNLFVDTSVWSMALRRDAPERTAHVNALVGALERGDPIFTTGLILQELLQGFSGPKAREQVIERFTTLPFVVPDRRDHIDAADVRNSCRRAGVQLGTIDALLAQLCRRHSLTLLTTGQDFSRIDDSFGLRLWKPQVAR